MSSKVRLYCRPCKWRATVKDLKTAYVKLGEHYDTEKHGVSVAKKRGGRKR